MEVPPRVAEGVAARPIMGEFSAPAKFALVGMPKTEKTTLFRTLTSSRMPLEHFQTTEVNEGVLEVQREEFDWLCEIYQPKEKLPAIVKLFDTPGLVRAAYFKKGIGNSFLNQIEEANILLLICRAFEDPEIEHVDGDIDPVRDLECLRLELQLKDTETLERRFDEIQKQLQRKKSFKSHELELKLCIKALMHLREGKDIRLGDWKDSEAAMLEKYNLLTGKANVYLVNICEADYLRRKNKFLRDICDWAKKHGAEPVIPFCGAFEENPANHTRSMLPRIINTCFDQSRILHFFTADADQVKTWQFRSGTHVAEMVFSFGRGISSVQVAKLADVKGLTTSSDVEAASRKRKYWNNYIIQDGDIIFAGGS